MMKSCVSSGGLYDHSPIVFHLEAGEEDYWALVEYIVDVSGSIEKVFPHRSMCLDMWKSSKSFYSWIYFS
jgi:hypothetical protein